MNHYQDISEVAGKLGLNLTNKQMKQMIDYLILLQRWNAAYNLSAIKNPQQMLVKHLFDCMAVVTPIKTQLIHNVSTCEMAMPRVLDVGSGAGLPGIVLAICLPDVHVTMVDSVQKKIVFVRQAIAQLNLPNAHAHSIRIQDWKHTYSLVTTRAWTTLAAIPTLAGHCVGKGGCIAAMKGPRLPQEAQLLSHDWQIDRVLDIVVPQLNEPRTLAFLSRKTLQF